MVGRGPAAGPRPDPAKDLLAFDDVAIYFSDEEWQLLEEWQKELYKNTIQDNYMALDLLGSPMVKPDILARIEQGEEPYIQHQHDSAAIEGYSIFKPEMVSENRPGDKMGIWDDWLSDHEDSIRQTVTEEVLMNANTEKCLTVYTHGRQPHEACPEMTGDVMVKQCDEEKSRSELHQPEQRTSSQSERMIVSHPDSRLKDTPTWKIGLRKLMMLEGRRGAYWRARPATESEKRLPEQALKNTNTEETHFPVSTDEKKPQETLYEKSKEEAIDPSHEETDITGLHLSERTRERAKGPKLVKSASWKKGLVKLMSQAATKGLSGGEGPDRDTGSDNKWHHRSKRGKELKMPARKEPFRCSKCGNSFKRSDHLKAHERTHTGQRPYKCAPCGKGFCQTSSVYNHERTHTGKNPYPCFMCRRRYAEKRSLHRHQQSPISSNSPQISIVPEKSEDAESMQDQGRPHTCPGNTLKRHRKIHAEDLPFKCAECGKGYSAKLKLIRHSQSHTRVKPYQCDDCEKCFVNLPTLHRHQRTHTLKKPYKCSTCKKCFTVKSSLKRHQGLHAEEKPFKFM